jgi:hypothetical protein
MCVVGAPEVSMSRERDDVDDEILLPAGMELVVPPAPRPAAPEAAADDGTRGSQAAAPGSRDDAARPESRRASAG